MYAGKWTYFSDKIYIQKRNGFLSYFWLASFFHIQPIYLVPFTHPNWVCYVKAEISSNKMGNFLCCHLKCSPRDIAFTLYGFNAWNQKMKTVFVYHKFRERKKQDLSLYASVRGIPEWKEHIFSPIAPLRDIPFSSLKGISSCVSL